MTRNTMTTLILLIAVAGLAIPAGVALAQDTQDAPTTQPATSQAAELTADEIVQRANQANYYQGVDGRAHVQMEIHDADGPARNREMTILRRDQLDPDADLPEVPEGASAEQTREHDQFAGEQKFYIYFHRPSDVNGMSYLVHKHLDRDDDRWLYMPGVDLVNRIAGSDKRTPFVGSHFFYEDVSGRNINADNHEIDAERTDETYYVIRNTPKDPDAVEFSYYLTYIHRETFLVIRNDYYDRQGQLYRRYEARQFETIQGYPMITASRMRDMLSGGYTDMQYTDVRYNIGIDEDIFTERYLRRPPRRYLR